MTITEMTTVDRRVHEALDGLSAMVEGLSEADEVVDPAVDAERSMLIRRLSAKVMEAADIATGYASLSTPRDL